MNSDHLSTNELKRSGGPRSAQGKAASRANAMKHGLSASTLLPTILDGGLIEHYQQQLRAEWQPATPTQEFFVLEMARHRAALDRIQQIEEAVLRRGARGAVNSFGADDAEDFQIDAALAAAGTSEAIDRITRYRRPHERAFLKNLMILRELQAKASHVEHPSQNRVATPTTIRAVFLTDAECEAYLLNWQFKHAFGCSRCGQQGARKIMSRKVLQCRGCRQQTSLRAGTVMERSRLGVLVWFQAIEILLKNPSVSTAKVMDATGLRRLGTVRAMVRRIRAAMRSSRVATELAGLDRVFLPDTST